MKPWRKCCHFWDKALCHVLLQPSLPPSEGRKEGIGGGSLWTWLGCRWCRPTHWHNPRMASECAHSNFEFPPSPLLLFSAFLHIYCMYYLTLSFKKLLEKWGLTHFFGLSTTVCRRREGGGGRRNEGRREDFLSYGRKAASVLQGVPVCMLVNKCNLVLVEQTRT